MIVMLYQDDDREILPVYLNILLVFSFVFLGFSTLHEKFSQL